MAQLPDSAPLSIGLVTPGWPADAFPNGIATYTATVAPVLRELGHRVSILADQVAGAPDDDSVCDLARYRRSFATRVVDALAYRLAPRSTTRRIHGRRLAAGAAAVVAANGVDIVEMEESFGFASWVRASVAVPVCVRLHGPWFLNGAAVGAADDEAFRDRVAWEREAIAAAAGITAPSRDVLDRTRARYGLELPGAEVIPYPVAPPAQGLRWAPDACDRSRVVFIGRFDRHKGGDLVIEAFAKVLEAMPGATLTFVGPDRGCVTGDGRRWTLRELVERRLPGALESRRVEWLGQQPLAALAPLRLRAAVTVVASRYETFCYAAAEAMALGCPVVSTDAGAIPEVIADGRNGLLCRSEDVEGLAAAIVRLLADPELAARLGRQAALDCARLFHPTVVASRMVAFYRRVLSASRGATGA